MYCKQIYFLGTQQDSTKKEWLIQIDLYTKGTQ